MATESTELLSMIQTSAKNGTLLPSCAPEVKELMVQIDHLISGKQEEWESSCRALNTQLHQRDRDLAALSLQLRERNAQVDRLRQESSTLEREYRGHYHEYERELEQLRAEVARLTTAYTRLRAKRSQPRIEGKQEQKLRESVTLLQETVQSKDQLIRSLQEELSFAQLSAQANSCQTELCQAQARLRGQLTLDRALREELGRLTTSHELTAWLSDHVRMLEQQTVEQGKDGLHEYNTDQFESELEQIVEKHFSHLDISIKNLFSTHSCT